MDDSTNVANISDDKYFELVFKYGDLEDLEALKFALIQMGDWMFASAVQGRIDELVMKSNC